MGEDEEGGGVGRVPSTSTGSGTDVTVTALPVKNTIPRRLSIHMAGHFIVDYFCEVSVC